jgi:hypothetical protein
VSLGSIWTWLKANGKKIVGDKLRDVPAEEAAKEAAEAAEQAATANANAGPTDAEHEAAKLAKLKTAPVLTVIHDTLTMVSKLARISEALFERADTAGILEESAKAVGISVVKSGESGFDKTTFPSLAKIQLALEAAQKKITETEKAKVDAENAAKAKAKEEAKKAADDAKELAKNQAKLSPDASFDPKPGDADYSDWATKNPDKAKANEEARKAAK